ncbi:MAG: hypothetical protein J0H64_07935, partial [Actinobacteria bacterium]|nr:hypothetical protein [Actinomycetota bacterium]
WPAKPIRFVVAFAAIDVGQVILAPVFLAVTIGEYELIATLSAGSIDELLELADRLRASPEIASIHTWTNLRTVKEEYGRGDRLAEE